MKKCVITGNQTNTMTNNIPVSAEGRVILSELHEVYNKKIKEEFVNKALGRAKEGNEEEFKEDELTKVFEKLAPQVSRNKMLDLVNIGVQDAIETLNEVKDANK
jgi:cobyric acid synthase